jgi:hypothetical protein
VWSDSGKYECRAKNKLTLKRPVSNFTWLDVLSKHNPTTERTSKYTPGRDDDRDEFNRRFFPLQRAS